jgi:hypothetical protein
MTAAPGTVGPRKPSPLLITLIVIGGILLLTVVALLFLLLGRNLGGVDNVGVSTTATPTPSAVSPSPSATEAQQPVEDTTPRFTSFNAVTEVACPQDGTKPEIQFNWTTAHATQVWYTSGKEDAIDDNYMQVPLNGSQNDLTDEHLFPCNHRSAQTYTVTLLGDDGTHVSQQFTVTDTNWTGDPSTD